MKKILPLFALGLTLLQSCRGDDDTPTPETTCSVEDALLTQVVLKGQGRGGETWTRTFEYNAENLLSAYQLAFKEIPKFNTSISFSYPDAYTQVSTGIGEAPGTRYFDSEYKILKEVSELQETYFTYNEFGKIEKIISKHADASEYPRVFDKVDSTVFRWSSNNMTGITRYHNGVLSADVTLYYYSDGKGHQHLNPSYFSSIIPENINNFRNFASNDFLKCSVIKNSQYLTSTDSVIYNPTFDSYGKVSSFTSNYYVETEERNYHAGETNTTLTYRCK